MPGRTPRCPNRIEQFVATRAVISKTFTGQDTLVEPTGADLCQPCSWGYRTAGLRAQPHLVTGSPILTGLGGRAFPRDPMEHVTTLLLGLAGCVAVERVERHGDGVRGGVCRDGRRARLGLSGVRGVLDRGQRKRDDPAERPALRGRSTRDPAAQRRWRCVESRCDRQSFTESIREVPAPRRTTGRLRRSCVGAVIENRSVDEVARAHGLSWRTVQRSVDDHARARRGEPV